jgi:hypothetical protein
MTERGYTKDISFACHTTLFKALIFKIKVCGWDIFSYNFHSKTSLSVIMKARKVPQQSVIL